MNLVVSYFDLKKKVKTVNHAILITKLNYHGIRGNVHEWFNLYLSHREEFVIVSGDDSISHPLTCAVPRGLPNTPA